MVIQKYERVLLKKIKKWGGCYSILSDIEVKFDMCRTLES